MKGRLWLSLLLLLALCLGLAACEEPVPDGPGGVQGTTYTVSYCFDDDHDGVDTEPDEIDEVAEGGHAVGLSLAPTVAYELEGWYLLGADGTRGEKWNFATAVTEDITLVANWRLRTYSVFYFVDGILCWSVDIPYGELNEDPYVAFPEECEKVDAWKAQLDEGKVFLGWETADGEHWDFASDTVTERTNLHAVFGPAA